MKNFLSACLLLLSIPLITTGQTIPELMYYKFDVPGSTVFNEASAPVGTNPAPIQGTLTSGGVGQFGGSLIGLGANSTANRVNTGWATNLTSDWTISFWTSNVAPSTTLWYILGDVNAGGFRCFTNGVAGAGNWVLRGPGITDVFINGGATVAPHVMHYVYDSSVPEIRGYLDGVLVTTVAQTAALNITGTGPFTVGAYGGNSGLSGNMDEFRLYDRALSATEVANTWNAEVPLTVSDYPYCQGFENGNGSWSDGGTNNDWELGTPTNTVINTAAPNGTNSWVTDLDGDHSNNSQSFVQSLEFDFSNLIDPTVSMNVWWESDFALDGASLQTSIDSGASWQSVGSATSAGTNWYTSANVGGLGFTGTEDGWTGSNGTGATGGSNGWLLAEHPLTGLAGQSQVFMRVVFGSDGSVPDEGFAFDNVCVGEPDDVGITAIFAPADTFCGLDSTIISVSVCNLGIHDQSNFQVGWDTNGTGGTVMYTGTLSVGQCDTIDVVTFNSSAGGQYDFSSWTNLAGDVQSNNDTAYLDSILIYTLPTGSVTGGATICTGDVASIDFNLSGSFPITFGYTDSTNVTSISGVSTSPFVLNTVTGGVYSFFFMTDSVGCMASASSMTGSATVVVNPLPTVDLGPDSTVCGDYLLDAGAGFVSYIWQDSTTTTQTFTATSNATYGVEVTDANGCVGIDEVNLNVNPLPVVNLGGDAELCEGQDYTFNAGAGFLGYVWDDASTGQVRTVNALTTVSVTVTDFNGCTGSDMASIVGINPLPTVSLGQDINIHPNDLPVTLDAGTFAGYLWDDNSMLQTRDVTFSGTFYVVVTDDNGCEGTDSISVFVYPNGIGQIGDEVEIRYYPNPTKGGLFAEISGLKNQSASMSVTNLQGQVVHQATIQSVAPNHTQFIDLSEQAKGVYFVRFTTDVGTHTARIVIE